MHRFQIWFRCGSILFNVDCVVVTGTQLIQGPACVILTTTAATGCQAASLKPQFSAFHQTPTLRVHSHWALAMLFALAGIARNGYCTHSLGKFSTHFCIAYGNAIVKSSVWTELNSWLLPPTNEVWGKVIFSQACVGHSVHREGISVWCHFLSGCLVLCSFQGFLSLVPYSYKGVSV